MRVFFYGTLMDEAVRAAVLGRLVAHLTLERAVLVGWRRATMRGTTYPVIVRAAGHHVDGLLATGIDREGLIRLDRFEEPEYRRIRVRLRRKSGPAISAWVYAARSPAMAAAPWNLTDWQRRYRAALLQGSGRATDRLRRFRSRF